MSGHHVEATRSSTSLASGQVDWLAVTAVLIVASMLAVLSVLRLNGYNAGMLDIGNHSQAIWSVTQGRPLEYTREDGNVSRLSWHAEIVYLALAGLYALAPDPRILLVFQALWFALGALPVYRLAARRFRNPLYARVLMIVYLLYPTAQTAVLFDIHGDTLAMTCLAFTLDALDRDDIWRYAVWLGVALLCKVYVAVAVGALGALLFLRGRQKLGIATAVVSLVWLLLLLFVVRPAFSPPLEEAASARFKSYLNFYFTGLGNASLVSTLGARLATALLILTPALINGRRAWRWLLPGLATSVPALLSIGEGAAYDYRFHHYALSVPFLVMAVIGGLDASNRGRSTRDPLRLRHAVLFQGAISLLFFVLLVDTPLNPRFWLVDDWGVSDTRYGQTSRDRLKDTWLAEEVPPAVPIATSDLLAPHVANRQILYQVRYTGRESDQQELFVTHLDEVNYVVIDALNDYGVDGGDNSVVGGVLHYASAIEDVMAHPDFALQSSRDGLLLFGRSTETTDVLRTSLHILPDDSKAVPLTAYDDRVELVSVSVEPLGGCRFSIVFTWRGLKLSEESAPLMAVSHIDEVANSRFPHLPTMLYPPSEWEPGTVVVEMYDIELPADLPLGVYHLQTGWYDVSRLTSHYTDERTRIGDEYRSAVLDCPGPASKP